MDKLKLAHEYALEMAKQGIPLKSCKELGWKYADAMQAEAKKREQEESEKASKEIKDILENHEHVFVDGRICWCGKIKSDIEEEWQPDWSQAPDWANWWALDLDNLQAHWYENRPNLDVIAWHRTTRACKQASLFDYDGDWYDSLRKRP